jgi:hypothetical protein
VRAVALGALAIAAAACVDNDAPDASELLHPLAVAPDRVIADGQSTATVTLCASDDGGRDPSLTATLAATSGAWVAAPDGGTQRTSFVLDRDGCRTLAWRAPQSLDAPTIVGTVGNPPYASAMAIIALATAALDVPVLSAEGQLLASGMSTVTVTAALRAKTGGSPTIGTLVDFTVTAKPAGVAYFTAPRRELVTGDTVSSTLLVSATALSAVTIRVVATAGGGAGSASAMLTVPAL